MTDTTDQQVVTPWFAWPARKTWEEVRVRLRSRDGNEWEEIASDFEYWMQSADGEMCDDVVAFKIIGETPVSLASVSSASAETANWIPSNYSDTPEPVPATNQAGEVELRDALDWAIAEIEGRTRYAFDIYEREEQYGAALAKAKSALATQPATSQEGEKGHFETLEAHEHEDQRELMLLYNHEPHDLPQFNRGQMRTAIYHGRKLGLRMKTSGSRGFPMTRLFWRLKYTILSLRSRYDFTPLSAWSQSASSWDDSEDGKMTPEDCFREDAFEWRLG